MNHIDYIVLAVWLLLSAASTAFVISHYGLRLPNFKGEKIPAIGGLSMLLYGEFAYAYVWFIHGIKSGTPAAYFLVTFAFGLLGLVDDLYGSRKVGGFSGHFNALRRGQLTTGAAKAIGGSVAALAAGFIIGRPSIIAMVLAALLTGLAANTANLLDLRPGRALFACLIGAAAIIAGLALHKTLDVGLLLYIALPLAIGLYVFDSRGKLMLGDVGSNIFGALIGLSAALFCPWAVQLALVVVLGALQVWSEKHSITATIEANPVLRAIDGMIGVR